MLSLLLIISGDIQSNPGSASTIYPCGLCEARVGWSHQAVCCDGCDLWYHKSCLEIDEDQYSSLNRASLTQSQSIFHSYEIELSNSYSVLSHRSAREDISLHSLTSPLAFNPPTHSSPVHVPSSGNVMHAPHRIPSRTSVGSPKASLSTSVAYRSPPKKNNLRTLIVNCNSIQGKAASFASVANYIDPDIILGTESKLGPDVSSAEVFPPGVVVHRKDRKHGGGGVFVAIKDCYPSSCVSDLDTGSSEQVWARLSLQNTKDMYVGSFYRPPNVTREPFSELQNTTNILNERVRDKVIILGGDFNAKDVDWKTNTVRPGSTIKPVCEALLTFVEDSGLTQLQREPTRESSVLDLYLTNNPTLVKGTYTIPGISDHDIIVIDSIIKPVIQRKQPQTIYKFSNANWEDAKKDTATFSASFIDNNTNDVHTNWDILKAHLNNIISTHIPSRKSSGKPELPWLESKLRRAITRKKKLYFKARRSKNDQQWQHYKQAKRDVQRALHHAERNYINNILVDGLDKNDTKPFWKYIQSKKQESIGVAPLRKGTQLNSDSKVKAQILNEQFQSVFTKEDDSCPQLEGPSHPPITTLDISVEGVRKLLSELRVNKASGPDNIPNRVLRELADELAPALHLIFTQSLSSNQLPSDWRNANISPIFKKGDRHVASNYRPVSLTSVCCKMLEHIVLKHIRNHLDNHGILNKRQHGFRRKHSTESQLLITLHDLTSLWDHKSYKLML